MKSAKPEFGFVQERLIEEVAEVMADAAKATLVGALGLLSVTVTAALGPEDAAVAIPSVAVPKVPNWPHGEELHRWRHIEI